MNPKQDKHKKVIFRDIKVKPLKNNSKKKILKESPLNKQTNKPKPTTTKKCDKEGRMIRWLTSYKKLETIRYWKTILKCQGEWSWPN